MKKPKKKKMEVLLEYYLELNPFILKQNQNASDIIFLEVLKVLNTEILIPEFHGCRQLRKLVLPLCRVHRVW